MSTEVQVKQLYLTNRLAESPIQSKCTHGCEINLWMSDQHVFNLFRVDIYTTTNNDLLRAANNTNIPIGVHGS